MRFSRMRNARNGNSLVFSGIESIVGAMPKSTRPDATAFNFRHASSSRLGKITLSGFGLRHGRMIERPRRFGQYAIVYILDGRGSYHDANGCGQKLAAGDLIIVFPDLEHLYNPDHGTLWVTSYLCFHGPVFDLWREHGILDPRSPVHHLSPIDLWNRRFEAVLGPARDSGFAPPLLEICRLQEFLAQIVTGAGRSGTHQGDLEWAARACRLLENIPGEESDWPSVARQLGASSESFRKRFKQLTGQSPARFRNARRIDRACELMQEGKLTDRQIAAMLGFCDEFYFSRRFKQITGKSPRAFRQSMPFADAAAESSRAGRKS